jgi:hypothetical protein
MAQFNIFELVAHISSSWETRQTHVQSMLSVPATLPDGRLRRCVTGKACRSKNGWRECVLNFNPYFHFGEKILD